MKNRTITVVDSTGDLKAIIEIFIPSKETFTMKTILELIIGDVEKGDTFNVNGFNVYTFDYVDNGEIKKYKPFRRAPQDVEEAVRSYYRVHCLHCRLGKIGGLIAHYIENDNTGEFERIKFTG